MAEDIHHLVSNFMGVERALVELMSGKLEPSQASLNDLDTQIALTFDAILEAELLDEHSRLTRIGFLLERLVKTVNSDELRVKMSNKIFKDATALAKTNKARDD